MLVFGWDSVVVEGWSSCFVVGFVVVFWDEVVDFGELILSVIALPGDLQWVVRGLNDKMCVWLRRVVGLDVAFLDAD